MSPQGRPRTDIGGAAVLGLVISAVNILGSIARSKVVALNLGPGGVGVVAEINQVIALAMVPAAAFSGPALTRAVAGERERTGTTVAAALSWTLLFSCGAAMVSVLGGPWMAPVADVPLARTYLALAGLGSLAGAVAVVASTTLVAAERLAESTRLQVIGSVVVTALVCGLTPWLGLEGQFLALAVAPVVGAVLGLAALRREGLAPAWRALPRFEKSYFSAALGFGVVTLVAGGAHQGALTVTRWVLDANGGHDLNGQFQAAWSVGGLYLGVVLSGLGNFIFPRYAAAATTPDLEKEISAASRFVFQVAPPVVLLAISFRDVLMRLLYSERFSVASEILGWQLAGDVAKAESWVFAGVLLYRARTRAFLLTESIAAAMLAGFSWLLVPWVGNSGAGMAYFSTYVLYLVVTSRVVPRAVGLAGPPRTVPVLVVSAVLALFNGLLTQAPWLRWCGLAAALVWVWKMGLWAPLQRRVLNRLEPLWAAATRRR